MPKILAWQQKNPERTVAAKMKTKHKARGVIYPPGQTRASLRAGTDACKVCGRVFNEMKTHRIHLDHDHAVTDRPNVRGLICGRCNWTLGAVEDSTDLLHSLARYLEDWRASL